MDDRVLHEKESARGRYGREACYLNVEDRKTVTMESVGKQKVVNAP